MLGKQRMVYTSRISGQNTWLNSSNWNIFALQKLVLEIWNWILKLTEFWKWIIKNNRNNKMFQANIKIKIFLIQKYKYFNFFGQKIQINLEASSEKFSTITGHIYWILRPQEYLLQLGVR